MKIPCDDDEALEERTLTIGEGQPGDALPAALRTAFAGGGEVDAEKAKAEAVRALGARGMGISSEAIARETAGGSTETFALVRPSEANGWRGVYLYLDEVGMLKGLPIESKSGTIGAGVWIRWGELLTAICSSVACKRSPSPCEALIFL